MLKLKKKNENRKKQQQMLGFPCRKLFGKSNL